jgi:endoglucanase
MKPLRTTLALLLAALAIAAAPALANAAPLSIKVEGNHFVNGEGQTIRLLGVNRTSSEYACAQGYAYDDGHYDDADAAAIAAWNANAVRVPLNEDCWLGVNGQPNSNQGADPELTRDGYRAAIESYVAALNAHGLYAILDLHWTAPGNQVALEQQPMPDFDHSIAFWESVATTFKGNPAVVFDLFNEPYDPTDPRSGDDQKAIDAVTWDCWQNGTKPDPVGGGAPPTPCYTQAYDENIEPTQRYRIAGMQQLLDAVRGTGATQPVLAGGLNFADDLTGWLAHEPTDPLHQLAASFHNYMGDGKCDDVACWNSEVAPVAAAVPVVTGEFAEDNYEEPGCNEGPNNFDNEYMGWADAHGVGYLAWAWTILDPPAEEENTCSRFYLIGSYSGTPASVNGIAVHAHLATLPPGGRTSVPPASGGGSGSGGNNAGGGSKSTPGGGTIRLTRFKPTVEAGGGKVSFQISAPTSCAGTIVGQTVKAFKLGGKKPHKVGLGQTKVSLTGGKTTTVTMKLAPKARGLLKAKGSLLAAFTVTLQAAGGAPTVLHPTATLKASPPKKKHRKR